MAEWGWRYSEPGDIEKYPPYLKKKGGESGRQTDRQRQTDRRKHGAQPVLDRRRFRGGAHTPSQGGNPDPRGFLVRGEVTLQPRWLKSDRDQGLGPDRGTARRPRTRGSGAGAQNRVTQQYEHRLATFYPPQYSSPSPYEVAVKARPAIDLTDWS